MSGLSVLSYVCAFVLLGAFTLKPQPRTEAPNLTSTTIPEFGVANRLPDANEALLPLDNPLAEGMSFEGLRDLINAVASAPIEPGQVEVLDGDTIRVAGETFRLVGFDAPETYRARCPSEREL